MATFDKGMSSIISCFTEGRYHTQRILKNAGASFATGWMDVSYASGQPAYDARVGVPLTFTQAVASKNDAVFFPPIGINETRYLAGCTLRAGQSGAQSMENTIVFDLLGYYPLIDGDSTDIQAFDNTLSLPRYSDGKGVMMCLVNHVAPNLAVGNITVNYTDSDNVARTITIATSALLTIGMVMSNSNTTTSFGSPFIPLNGGSGVKSVQSVTFNTAPGGLYCLYLVKPLMNFNGIAGPSDNLLTKEKWNCVNNGFKMPIIHDGAWISMFHYHTGTARTTSWFGDFTFIWN